MSGAAYFRSDFSIGFFAGIVTIIGIIAIIVMIVMTVMMVIMNPIAVIG